MIKQFTYEDFLNCYGCGIFPMADDREDKEFFLVEPEERAVFFLDQFYVPSRLRRKVRQSAFDVRIDTAFHHMVRLCAQKAEDRATTWISYPLEALYLDLFSRKYAHSIEVFDKDVLVGGLFGVALGPMFFGESMVSRATDASKIALVHLVAALKKSGYLVLDCQFETAHLAQFNLKTLHKNDYKQLLETLIGKTPKSREITMPSNGHEAIEIIDKIRSEDCDSQ